MKIKIAELVNASYGWPIGDQYVGRVETILQNIPFQEIVPGHTLGIFFNKSFHEIVLIPTRVRSVVTVSSEFHIKPIFRYLQSLVDLEQTLSSPLLERRRFASNWALGIEDTAKAIVNNEVSRIFLVSNKIYWGVLDAGTGVVIRHFEQENAQDGDLLNKMLLLAQKKNISVHIVAEGSMPRDLPAVALLKTRKTEDYKVKHTDYFNKRAQGLNQQYAVSQ